MLPQVVEAEPLEVIPNVEVETHLVEVAVDIKRYPIEPAELLLSLNIPLK